jgi:hypothetical protein
MEAGFWAVLEACAPALSKGGARVTSDGGCVAGGGSGGDGPAIDPGWIGGGEGGAQSRADQRGD